MSNVIAKGISSTLKETEKEVVRENIGAASASIELPATILDKLKTVDGSGSGLDADLLRGLPANFTSSLAENGYQILPSGLIIQWGLSTLMTVETSLDVALPISFPVAGFVATATPLLTTNYSGNTSAYASFPNNSTIRLVNDASGTGSSAQLYFIAIGY